MSEVAQAFNWTVTTMQADSALMAAAVGGVWVDFAPIGTLPPFALVGQQAGTDVLTTNAVRLFVHLLMRIQAIGPVNNYAALIVIADRIDALFRSVRSFSLSSGGVLACYREQTLAYSNLVNGAQWSYLGGLYHIELQGV